MRITSSGWVETDDEIQFSRLNDGQPILHLGDFTVFMDMSSVLRLRDVLNAFVEGVFADDGSAAHDAEVNTEDGSQ